MHPGQPCLAIGYGADSTRAVIAWPDGRWQLVFIDDLPVLPSAAHTDGMLTGHTAWRHTTTSIDGFVASPLRTLTAPDTDEAAVGAQAAATLRRCADEAARIVGTPVEDVRMVVPAGWGPRRRTWLRQAAAKAGLGQPRLIEAPVAAADRLLAVGVQMAVGSLLLIGDLGAGCEATVLRRGPQGFEILSTLTDPDAGAWAVDEHLMTTLSPDIPTGSQLWWQTRAAIRAAREQLSQQPVVTVAMPAPTPPIVLHAHLVDQGARPVWSRAADLMNQALSAAEVTPAQLTGSYLIGGTAATGEAARVISVELGYDVTPTAEPGFAAVLGAAQASAPAPNTGPSPTLPSPVPAFGLDAERLIPSLWRLISIVIPAVASLLLYWHLLAGADHFSGSAADPRIYFWKFATWGELGVAAVLALIAALAAGSLLGAALTQGLHRDGALPAVLAAHPGRQIAGGIVVATALGLAVAALYGVTAAFYLNLPLKGPLGWALWPTAPVAAAALTLAALIARRHTQPARGWNALLAFPTSSVLLTTTGMIMLAWSMNTPLTEAVRNFWGSLAGIAVGAGIACALARGIWLRLTLGLVLAVFGILMANPTGDFILAGAYATAVTAWCLYRIWVVLRLPTMVPAHAH